MASSAWVKFDKGIYYGMIGTVDFDDAGAGVFKCALVLNTWTPSVAADTWTSISAHEHANANGYTTGGAALTGVTFTNSSGTDKWDANTISWTASGGPITARYAVIYHVASDKALRYCELEVGSDKTSTDGNDFVIEINTSGIFDIV